MNSFKAFVTSIKNERNLHLVSFEMAKTKLWMTALELPNIRVGDLVRLGFKSSSVTLAADAPKRISFSNHIKATVESIANGKLLYSVLLNTSDGKIESIMTHRAFEMLDVKKGASVTAFIKSSEITIQEVISA